MDDGRYLSFNVAHLELFGRENIVQVKDCVLFGDSLDRNGGNGVDFIERSHTNSY